MGILDEAIREHLELKRQHGAGESELKELEDEAFGPTERPGDEEAPADEFAEAPTEFIPQPGGEGSEPTGLESLKSAEEPETGGDEAQAPSVEQAPRRREPAPEISDLQEGPEEGAPEPTDSGDAPEEPVEEESPAMEHEAIRPDEIDVQQPPSPGEGAEPASSGPSTEERHAIADQPTEMYDVEDGEFSEVESTGPAAGGDVADEDEDDDFFDEKRLSDELDQALEAPGDIGEEADADALEAEPETGGEEPEEPDASSEDEEDLLEETPDFLEEAPEDDRLWFEQKPPKDFDFDD